MMSHRVRGLSLLHGLLQTVALQGLFWAWTFLARWLTHDKSFNHRNYFVYSVVLAIASLLDLGRSKLTRKNLLHLDIIRNHSMSVRQSAVTVGCLLIFLVASKDIAVSRIFLFTFAPATYLLVLASNAVFPSWLAAHLFHGRSAARTILLGSRESAAKLRPWLKRKASYGFQPIGIITGDAVQDDRIDLPILGSYSDVKTVLRDNEATQLIVLDLPLLPEQIVDIGDLCDKFGIRLLIVNDLEDKLHRSISFFDDDGFHFIGFRQEPLECPVGRTVKRFLDLAVALPVVLFILPSASLLVWFFQRTQSPGPLFFRQKRTGKYNQPFLIFKFRTMHVNNEDEARQASRDDPRVFRAGKWLRKLSIDELPQFINVLTGEMSVVGPRPHLVDHDLLFGEIAHFYRVRSFIKPGITGLAQVRGLRGEARKEQDLIDRIHSDVYYLENWSPLLDWVIIFKTAWQVMAPPKTAY
ncbi:MAG TPA: exopolysaccharide biosynthesis polyprenyl glycosylphosphotransferase [Chthoniobacteraceae bacterium]|nr:exopolysaccharide biosynthesis polyprenyl glycosylphosphotransferase [Chthoniobacteraceae bacterium]